MKISNFKFQIIFVYLFIGLFVVFPEKTGAAGLSLGIAPPIFQINAKAPANIKAPLFIENNGDDPIDLEIKLMPFTYSTKENGEVAFLSPNEQNQQKLNDPLIFQKVEILDGDKTINNITLSPNQQKELSLHINLPQDEPPSDYYFSITFVSKENQGATEIQTSSTTAIGGISSNVLLSIGPKGKTTGIVEEFSSPLFLERGPVSFKVRVKNTSKHFINPVGQILITNMFGQNVGKVDLEQVNILSQSIRAIPDSLQQLTSSESAGINKKLTNIDNPKAFWPESFLLGPYTAVLTIALSDQGPVFTKTIHFFAFPIQGFIGLIIAVFLVLIVKSRLKKHMG